MEGGTEMNFPGWFVRITTDIGWLDLPFGTHKGYKTKREAEQVAEKVKNVPGTVKVEIRKG